MLDSSLRPIIVLIRSATPPHLPKTNYTGAAGAGEAGGAGGDGGADGDGGATKRTELVKLAETTERTELAGTAERTELAGTAELPRD
ncbi:MULTISPECIES: hypothetical protein [Paenibacillus]|nr:MULTISPECIES: hypothetical protein [Paenibacillus]MCY9658779.1 hypothetical protein [Paenibacillus anseongense]